MCVLVTFLPASPFIPSRQEQASRWVGWLFSLQLSEAPSPGRYLDETHGTWLSFIFPMNQVRQLDDGWPESEKDVFQAALRMVVVKDSRWIVGQFRMSYGRIWCEKVRLIKKRILGKGHQMTRVLQPQRERGRGEREREREWMKGG